MYVQFNVFLEFDIYEVNILAPKTHFTNSMKTNDR